MCVVKNPYISKAKSYISYFFFFLSITFNPRPTLRCVIILLYHIFFYLIDITYDYNKIVINLTNIMISYLFLFIYAFNCCFLTDL